MMKFRSLFVSHVVLAGLVAGCSAGAPDDSAREEPSGTDSLAAVGSRDPAKELWRRQISKTPLPKEGCFDAVHPSTQWVEVPCATGRHSHPAAPTMPVPADSLTDTEASSGASGGGRVHPFTSAKVSSGTLSSAEGSFPSATGLTSEKGNGASNSFSIQLNTQSNLTNSAITALCKSTATPASCKGWVQFVYWEGAAEIWYNLVGAGNKCPSSAWKNDGGACYFEAPNSAVISAQPISNLVNMTLTGSAGGTTDTVIVTTGPGQMHAATNTSLVDLSASWTYADFNVLGDSSYAEAVFNSGTTLAVQLLTDSGSTSPPACGPADSTTGESNNLSIVPGSCCTFGGSSPGVLWTESNAASPIAYACPSGSCGAANEPCCPGSSCHSGLTCYPLPASTETACLSAPPPVCGGKGQGCCNGTRCDTGLKCEAVSQTVDGHKLTAFVCE
ncbi:MAG TPA: hypothetical protein VGI39_06825 [Polyangiaceae bacterium]